MKIIRHTDADFAGQLRQLGAASSLFDPAIEERARGILAAVAARGDAALLEFTARFDGAQLAAGQLAVTQAELLAASLTADESLREAVRIAEKNIAQLPENRSVKTGRPGTRKGRALARSSIRSSALVFTSRAARRHWFPPR